MLIQKLKSLFLRHDLPEETRSLFRDAQTVRELLNGLDELLTRNEVEFEALNKEIEQLELIEQEEMEKIRRGNLPPRAKQNTLLYIKRLRKQMDNLQNRLYIYDRNIHLHLDLIAKIQDMEAMELRGVEEKDIDAIVLEFQKHLDRYMETSVALEAAQEAVSPLSEEEKKELEALEEEILATKKEEKSSSETSRDRESETLERKREEVRRELDETLEAHSVEEMEWAEEADTEELEELDPFKPIQLLEQEFEEEAD